MPARTTKPPAHILRHTFATTLIRGGTDLVIVAELLGHSRLDTVRVYTRPTAQDQAKHSNCYPPTADRTRDRASGHDIGIARYDSPSGTAVVRVGSLTWTIQDRAAADSMIEAWQYLADLAPVVLSRQARIRRR